MTDKERVMEVFPDAELVPFDFGDRDCGLVQVGYRRPDGETETICVAIGPVRDLWGLARRAAEETVRLGTVVQFDQRTNGRVVRAEFPERPWPPPTTGRLRSAR